MQIKSIVAVTAIALVAGVGFASANDEQFTAVADDQFTTVAGFEAQAMTKQEMGETRGEGIWAVRAGDTTQRAETVLILGGEYGVAYCLDCPAPFHP
jgi:hypothetical protein